MIAEKSLKEFVKTANKGRLAYNHDTKERWHRLARLVAQALAAKLAECRGDV